MHMKKLCGQASIQPE